MTLAFRSDETSPFVRALLEDQGIPADSVLLDIDARDEMLEFLLASFEGDRERALFAYFRSGLSIADAMTQVLRWRFRDPARIERLLDFASGYGRVTRFLLREVPAERFWVSDIYADAVHFQQERFGVHGVVSTILPADFECGERFDAILVTSLFTHLPEERFVGWLRRLLSLLRPGGMLLFSVHDEAILAPGVSLPPEGVLFQELSESNSLEKSDYGSTWVDEPFVRRALARASDEPMSLWRSPRGLCNFQDLYVAVREEGVDFSGLTLHAEPWLQIDRCVPRVDPATGQRTDVLEMRGWALMRSGEAREIQVSVDGQVLATAPVDGPRPDVAALVGERFVRSGWELTARLPSGISRNGSILIVRVVDGRGTGHPLWASTVETAFLASARQDADYLFQVLGDTRAVLAETQARAAADIVALQSRIAAMEASRFWKMRNVWFRLKGMVGIEG